MHDRTGMIHAKLPHDSWLLAADGADGPGLSVPAPEASLDGVATICRSTTVSDEVPKESPRSPAIRGARRPFNDALPTQSVSAFDWTLLTPRTFCASSMARARSAPLSTLPLSMTMPLSVFTEMSEPSTLLEYM